MKITIEIKAKPEKDRELYQTLQALILPVRAEGGCRDCRVCRDLELEDVFILTIDWEDQAHFERFIPSVTGGTLLGAIRLLGETAKVRIGVSGPWKVIDALKKTGVGKKDTVRKKAGSAPGHVDGNKMNRKEK